MTAQRLPPAVIESVDRLGPAARTTQNHYNRKTGLVLGFDSALARRPGFQQAIRAQLKELRLSDGYK